MIVASVSTTDNADIDNTKPPEANFSPAINTRPRRSKSTRKHSTITPLSPFTEADRDEFQRIFFDELNPRYGLLEVDEAQAILTKHGLSAKHFWKIWHIADSKHIGALDKHDFALAMYHVREIVSGRLATIPSETPQELYYEIVLMYSNPKSLAQVPASTTDPFQSPEKSSKLDQQAEQSEHTLRHPRRARSSVSNVQSTAQAAASASTSASAEQWDVDQITKASADEYFDTLDDQGVGFVDGDIAARFMLRYRLEPEDLALIWDLADLNRDNRLTREAFAIAIHLVQIRLSGGDIPHVLPPSLIPPSQRTKKPFLPPKFPSQPAVPTSSTGDTSQKQQKSAQFRLRRHTTAPAVPPKFGPGITRSKSSRVVSMSSVSAAGSSLQNNTSNVSLDNSSTIPTIPEHDQDSHAAETLQQQRETEQENHSLSLKIQELTAQLAAQRDLQTTNADLQRESTTLKAKLHDTEQLMIELLHANEAHIATREENQVLARRIAELEQDKLDALNRLDSAKEESLDLGRRLRAIRQGARLATVRSQEGAQEMVRRIQELERDNEELQRRCADMEISISRRERQQQQQSQGLAATTSNPGSSANYQEMEILMGDVTRENEDLKRRMRQMQRSTTQLLLTPNAGDQATIETLRRENIRLTNQIQDMENFASQLQRSAEDDSELQLVLRDVTRENETLQESLRDMRQQMVQMEQQIRELGPPNDPVEQARPLQKEIARLKAQVQGLQMELQATSSSSSAAAGAAQAHEDRELPPPAYED